jgi:protein-tyrosine-phosphatase
MTQLRDASGRFTYPQEPDPGHLWIEAPSSPASWNFPRSCSVVDFRRPLPDPTGEGGKGFEAVFCGTYAECDAWLEANT